VVNTATLKELRDIHWPKPPSFWPLATGYYIVLVLVILMVVLSIYYFLYRYRKNIIRRQLLSELNAMELTFKEFGDKARLQADISALLRRIVFLKNPDSVARASDLQKIALALTKILPSPQRTAQLVDQLEKDRFHKDPQIDGGWLLSLTREQIKRCRI
jgi:hypothetical protein